MVKYFCKIRQFLCPYLNQIYIACAIKLGKSIIGLKFEDKVNALDILNVSKWTNYERLELFSFIEIKKSLYYSLLISCTLYTICCVNHHIYHFIFCFWEMKTKLIVKMISETKYLITAQIVRIYLSNAYKSGILKDI